jgi:hypothetical protein
MRAGYASGEGRCLIRRPERLGAVDASSRAAPLVDPFGQMILQASQDVGEPVCGSMLLNLAVSISEWTAAARRPPSSEPAKIQLCVARRRCRAAASPRFSRQSRSRAASSDPMMIRASEPPMKCRYELGLKKRRPPRGGLSMGASSTHIKQRLPSASSRAISADQAPLDRCRTTRLRQVRARGALGRDRERLR